MGILPSCVETALYCDGLPKAETWSPIGLASLYLPQTVLLRNESYGDWGGWQHEASLKLYSGTCRRQRRCVPSGLSARAATTHEQCFDGNIQARSPVVSSEHAADQPGLSQNMPSAFAGQHLYSYRRTGALHHLSSPYLAHRNTATSGPYRWSDEHGCCEEEHDLSMRLGALQRVGPDTLVIRSLSKAHNQTCRDRAVEVCLCRSLLDH